MKIIIFLLSLLLNINHSVADYTEDWFSSNIKHWEKHKSLFYNKPNIHCLEIGSFEGRSSVYIVENYCNGNNSFLDSLDTWEGSIEHNDKQKQNLYQRFIANTAKYIEEKRMRAHRDASIFTLAKFVQEVRQCQRSKYDFIYVDGSHMAKDVTMDSLLGWELLNKGGVMIFDDYRSDSYKQKNLNPRMAIDYFMELYKGDYEILRKGYQIHIKKNVDGDIIADCKKKSVVND